MRLANEVALVQGGSRGMGRRTAERFIAEGATVVITGRNAERGQEAEKALLDQGGKALFVRGDISDESDARAAVEATMDTFGKLTVLVNNAGASERTLGASKVDDRVADVTTEAWDSVLGTDLRGAWLSSKYAIPRMIESGGGSIVNVSSICAQFGVAGLAAYSAAKAGLHALTRSTAVEYARDGIRCNCVVIGIVPNWQTSSFDADEDWLRAINWCQPIRLGQEDDFANTAVFLASPESGYMTAAIINLDGGFSAVSHLPEPPKTGGDPSMVNRQ